MNDNEWSDARFEAIDDMQRFRQQRGFTMRHPIVLLAVLAGSILLAYQTWPKAAFFFAEPTDCGELSLRPAQEAQKAGSAPPLMHDMFCRLKGINGQLSALATAKKNGEQPFKDGMFETKSSLEGVKYYVKLVGANVVAVIPANRDDIMRFRERKGSITGFEFDDAGRLIEPSRLPYLNRTASALRIRWAIPDSEKLFIFDLTQRPQDRWTDLTVVGIMLLTALLATFGLFRSFRRSRA